MIDDYAYATGRARSLESKIRAVETMPPSQVVKEYGIDERDIDGSLERLMEQSLAEFSDSAPLAVLPFRIMADLSNTKAFIRHSKTGEEVRYSTLGTFRPGDKPEEFQGTLKESGYQEPADKMKELLGMELREADLWLEQYFTGRISNRMFREYLEFRERHLGGEGSSEEYYKDLVEFVKDKSMLKNMEPEVVVAFLLLKQRELDLARARVMGAKEVMD